MTGPVINCLISGRLPLLVDELLHASIVYVAGDSPELLSRVRATLPSEVPVRGYGLQEVAQCAADKAAPLIIGLRNKAELRLVQPALVGRLADYPLVFVGESHEFADDLRRAQASLAAEYVSGLLIERELGAAVVRAHLTALLRNVGAVLESTSHLPAGLRLALAFACRSGEPQLAISRLAFVAQCDRCTLAHQWRRICMPQGLHRIEDFLMWLLLVRARSRKSSTNSWNTVARDCGSTPVTLRRIARRVAQQSLSEIAATSPAAVCEQFVRSGVLPLLQASTSGSLETMVANNEPRTTDGL